MVVYKQLDHIALMVLVQLANAQNVQPMLELILALNFVMFLLI
jgi:hypothetical protein